MTKDATSEKSYKILLKAGQCSLHAESTVNPTPISRSKSLCATSKSDSDRISAVRTIPHSPSGKGYGTGMRGDGTSARHSAPAGQGNRISYRPSRACICHAASSRKSHLNWLNRLNSWGRQGRQIPFCPSRLFLVRTRGREYIVTTCILLKGSKLKMIPLHEDFFFIYFPINMRPLHNISIAHAARPVLDEPGEARPRQDDQKQGRRGKRKL